MTETFPSSSVNNNILGTKSIVDSSMNFFKNNPDEVNKIITNLLQNGQIMPMAQAVFENSESRNKIFRNIPFV